MSPRLLVAAALAVALLAGLAPPVPGQAPRQPGAPGKAAPATRPKTEPKAEGKARAEAPRRPGERSSPIVIDADRMEVFQKEGLVIFTGGVVARQDNSTQTADRMEVYLDEKGERVARMISTGNVKIVTEDCRTGTARRAEYYDDEQKILLIGNAKVWQEENVVTGDEITLFLAQDRSIVEGGSQDRVKAVFYPKREDEGTPKEESRREAKRPAPCG